MSKAKSDLPNGHSKLEDALATLIQNQAAFVAQHFDLERRFFDLRNESDKRYAEIQSILAEHTRLLEQLPEAVQARMGFKP